MNTEYFILKTFRPARDKESFKTIIGDVMKMTGRNKSKSLDLLIDLGVEAWEKMREQLIANAAQKGEMNQI